MPAFCCRGHDVKTVDSRQRQYWDGLSAVDPDAAVIDPNDHRGCKNRYLAGMRDLAFKESLEASGVKKGTLLDLGCGSGSATLPLARGGHRVVGVDISGGLLRHAGERCRDSEVLFVRTGGGPPPLLEDVLDGAVVYGVLCYVIDDAEARRILEGVRSALKPGSPLVMIEQIRRSRRLVEDGFKVQRTRGELVALLEAAGFSVESTTILRHGRFPATPLVAAGLLPPSTWGAIRTMERRIAALSGVFPWDYAETRFVGLA